MNMALDVKIKESCAIMQPTFLPWLGYFSLIAQVTDFVFLDTVQLTKQSWQRRNQIAGPNGPVLLTLPVAKKPSLPIISEAKFADAPFADKLIARTKGCLGTAPHWPLVETLLTTGLARASDGLSALNIGLVQDLCATIGLETRFHHASRMDLPDSEKSDRLHQICTKVRAKTYLSPVGSAGYLREGHPFTEDDIRLRFMTYQHPEYSQKWKTFQSHMSVIDALAWVGPAATKNLILTGIGAPVLLEDLPEVQE